MQQNTTYNPKISIIIPFYQKEKGILKKSLISALSQKNVSNFEIIVIDDSSPIPAEEEYTDFNQDQISKIKTIKQKNQGPAGARNKGLDSISPETKYIAFLDSDDEWTSEHLSNALTALEFGFDFYFSDLYQLDQSISGFNRAKRIQTNDHPKIFTDNDCLRNYTGDMQEQIITGNIIGTPTVVYRYSHYPELRFREDLVRAGEDYIFWLSFISKYKTRIAFSSTIEVKCGKGVNIYSGTKFGTPEALELIYFEAKYRKIILKEFTLQQDVKYKIKKKIKEQHSNFLMEVLHALHHGKQLNLALCLRYIALSPNFLSSIPTNLLRIIKEKLG